MITQTKQRLEDIFSLESPRSLARIPFQQKDIMLSDHDLPKFSPDDNYTGRRFNIRDGKDTLDFYSSVAEICTAARHTGKHEKLVSGVYEAFRNAWQHGNKKDQEKAIEISYRATEDSFEVVVSDEGGLLNADFIPFVLLHRQGIERPLRVSTIFHQTHQD